MWKDYDHGCLFIPKSETTILQIRHHWGHVLAQCHGHKELIAKDAHDANQQNNGICAVQRKTLKCGRAIVWKMNDYITY